MQPRAAFRHQYLEGPLLEYDCLLVGSGRNATPVALVLTSRAGSEAVLRESDMQKSEYKKYRAALETKRAELGRVLRKRDEIAIEKTADALDEVQFATERELAIRNLDRESELMRAVSGALHRIDEGVYGACVRCEEDIKPRRLEAVPWAAYCVPCQEIIDRRKNEEGADSVDELVHDTA